MYVRNCPRCSSEITHKSKRGLYESIRLNNLCKKCGNEQGSLNRIGLKHTDETKKIISSSKIGINLSENHRRNISKSKYGKKLTEEHKINIGKSVSGLIRSEESIRNYSESKTGVLNPAKRPEVKEKISKSLITYYRNNPDYINIDKLSEYELYRHEVDRITRKLKIQVFELWSGLDYYDGEYIKDNLLLEYNDDNYPTIDHKISIINGFKLGLTYEKISSIENLCITKRKLNIKKGSLNYDEFQSYLLLE